MSTHMQKIRPLHADIERRAPKLSAGSLWDDESIQRVGMQSLLDLFNDSCAGMMAVDLDCRIAWINDKYVALIGANDAAEVLGKPVENVLPNSRMREVVKSGQPILLDLMTIRCQTLVVMRLPLKDEFGRVTGALGFTLYDRAERLKPLISKFTELESALAQSQRELANLRRSKYSLASFVGSGPVALELKRKARRAAQLDTTVLLLGETGTGKELLAQGIHAASDRAKHAFVAVNVAAVPEALLEAEFFGVAPGAYTGADAKGREGKFKVADGGTLFLDEIGDMPPAMQSKLLRVLQEQEIEALGSNKVQRLNVRVIAATSRNLKQLVDEGHFRADLYYRLNVLPIVLPPLRQRTEDLDALCEHLLAEISERTGLPLREITASARDLLAQYAWPGNVRELRNVLEQACMQNDHIQLDAADFENVLPVLLHPQLTKSSMPLTAKLPEVTAQPSGVTSVTGLVAVEEAATQCNPVAADSELLSLPAAIVELEKNYIQNALIKTRGNKAMTARLLGISRATLYQKLESFGLN